MSKRKTRFKRHYTETNNSEKTWPEAIREFWEPRMAFVEFASLVNYPARLSSIKKEQP